MALFSVSILAFSAAAALACASSSIRVASKSALALFSVSILAFSTAAALACASSSIRVASKSALALFLSVSLVESLILSFSSVSLSDISLLIFFWLLTLVFPFDFLLEITRAGFLSRIRKACSSSSPL